VLQSDSKQKTGLKQSRHYALLTFEILKRHPKNTTNFVVMAPRANLKKIKVQEGIFKSSFGALWLKAGFSKTTLPAFPSLCYGVVRAPLGLVVLLLVRVRLSHGSNAGRTWQSGKGETAPGL
jgi:hypothetical protein